MTTFKTFIKNRLHRRDRIEYVRRWETKTETPKPRLVDARYLTPANREPNTDGVLDT